MPGAFEHLRKYHMQPEREEAKAQLLVSMVCRKLAEKRSISEIANELGKTEEEIEQIRRIADKYAPTYDLEKISGELLEQKKLKS